MFMKFWSYLLAAVSMICAFGVAVSAEMVYPSTVVMVVLALLSVVCILSSPRNNVRLLGIILGADLMLILAGLAGLVWLASPLMIIGIVVMHGELAARPTWDPFTRKSAN